MKFRTKEELKSILIKSSQSIREAIKIIDIAHYGIGVIVDDNNIVKGILTDPDIRRLILRSIDFEESVSSVMNDNPILVEEVSVSKKEIQNVFIEKGFSQIPIVNENKQLVDLVLKSDMLDKAENGIRPNKIDASVVIMAGGRGTRMEPFTTILPKPLIPIGNKSMLEVIMEEYARFNVSDFCISVNYKANLIKAYLTDSDLDYNISYIQEDKPLGTAGSLKLLSKEFANKPFFVSNCDIIIRDDYSKIYDFHIKGNYAITMVASLQHHKIPYGVCEIENEGDLVTIKEKPEYNFLVNTGMYIINPEVLDDIPENEFFHITHLMDKIKKLGKKVGVFPVSEKSWIDVGQWAEYKDALSALKDN